MNDNNDREYQTSNIGALEETKTGEDENVNNDISEYNRSTSTQSILYPLIAVNNIVHGQQILAEQDMIAMRYTRKQRLQRYKTFEKKVYASVMEKIRC